MGEEYEVDFVPDDTVVSLKERIADIKDWPISVVGLVFGGNLFDHGRFARTSFPGELFNPVSCQ